MLPLEARGLFHIFRSHQVETVALRGADLALDGGSWVSVMGPSGSGKSTLLHVMGGLLEPSGGQVLLEGEDIAHLPPDERTRRRRERIGILLQRDNLHPMLDVQDNVALPLRLAGRKVAVGALLDQVGLGSRRHLRTGQLSGGEAQRAAVAVALATEPAVLLADEPTGELDETSAELVLDLLARARDRGTAVLTVTHSAAVAGRADRQLVMRDGQVQGD